MRYQRAESPALLNGHEAARRFFSASFEAQLREKLLVAHVDSATHCLHVEQYSGETTNVGLPIRDIVADALRLGSAGIIVAHNHPSGDPRPSTADCFATRKLSQVGESIDLIVLDHLIFAGGQCSSMRRMGLL